ncbi:MAG TPA: TerC family protein [Massilibacterium sp.]|nr:TerC family protein [Massilibacterium sp.]
MQMEFLTGLLIIIALDILLGGDNAVVIALASRNLPEEQRNKAIFIGTGLAIVIRIALTILAVYLLMIPYLQFIGGLFLLYIAYSLLVEKKSDHGEIKAANNLGTAIRTIVVADVIMALDNVLAIAGAANGNIILVVLGLLISVPIIIWGSKIILKWMERFPIIIYIGAAILCFTASKMMWTDAKIYPFLEPYDNYHWFFNGLIIILTLLIGKWSNDRQHKKA